jgi:uncharacterized protein (DUF736 family)
MAKIGSFTRKDDGSFAGTLRTLTLRAEVTLVPVERSTDKHPDYRIESRGADIGAGWTKRNADGVEYVRLTIDDVSLPAAIRANLVIRDDGSFDLLWTR